MNIIRDNVKLIILIGLLCCKVSQQTNTDSPVSQHDVADKKMDTLITERTFDDNDKTGVKLAIEPTLKGQEDNQTKEGIEKGKVPAIDNKQKRINNETTKVTMNIDKLSHEESLYIIGTKSKAQNNYNDDFDDPEELKIGTYFLIILTGAATLFMLFKLYRMRLTRAERKYGVQGNRSAQELTPLPMSNDNGCSDEEDHTLFDRHQIRIL